MKSGLLMLLPLFSMLELQSLKWVLAFYWQCKMILLKEFIKLFNKQLWFLNLLEVSDFLYIILEQLALILRALMEFLMGFFLCSKYSMRQQDMLIREVEKEKDHSPFILSHGTLIFLISFNWKRIMERKKIEQEIFFTLCGFQIYSWKELLKTVIGLYFAQIKLRDCMNVMVQNSKNCTYNMNKKGEVIWQSKLKKYGKPLLKVKLKQELHICYLKIMQILNQINKI